ncbi:MAG: hypothetical protein QNJ12_14470 [Ilumatobacter sp.]|uniref:hypothetical protein n=1 Tax=Ilumatobacter sp. TaxID=1967498 RepID=UPI00261E3713|nr:hypothetical protein [Ilumatobacter sp.]MDJ0770002.1 hypothetical protein [Ilumatobacter sp.]
MSEAVPPPPPASAPPQVTVYERRTPRPGELAPAWRIATAVAWIGVVVSFAAIWNVSVQLGLSTWWLGPRAQPEPRLVQLSPFAAPVAMLLATINQARWLPWWGLGAAGVISIYGIGDLGRVTSIAVVELLIAGAAAVLSVASLTGAYRRAPAPR